MLHSVPSDKQITMKTTFVRAFALLLSAGWMAAISRAEPDDVVRVLRWDARPAIAPESRGLVPSQRKLAVSCPNPNVETDVDCNKQGQEVRKQFEESIDGLEETFERRKCEKKLVIEACSDATKIEECEEKKDKDDYKICEALQSGICELKASKEQAVDRSVDSCEKQKEAAKQLEDSKNNVARALAEFRSRRALAPMGDPDTLVACAGLVRLTKETKISLTSTIVNLQITIESLATVQNLISITKDTFDALIVTFKVGVVIGLVLGLLDAVILALNIVILKISEYMDSSAFNADDCDSATDEAEKKVMKELAEDTKCIVDSIQESSSAVATTVDTIDTQLNDVENKVDIANTVVNNILATVDTIDTQLDGVENKVDIIDTVVDNIQATVNTIDTVVDALSCPFGENTAVFVGAGCDGLDNDCDSDIPSGNLRVDECDEDRVAPTLELSKDPPATFVSQKEAVAWFLAHTAVTDDCAPQDRLLKTVVDSSTKGRVTIRVEDTRCYGIAVRRALVYGRSLQIVDGPGAASTTGTFSFEIDGEAPLVSCGFRKPQDSNFAGGSNGDPLFIDRFNLKRGLVDVQFFFDIEVRQMRQ